MNLSTPALQPSSVHPAFEWVRSQDIESLNITVEEYRHRKTGAMHYHMAADNDENVFLVALRTVPMDSTGVAHMLEHTALCGSERYPVRDPFFMMIRRSLNTFMNAFTPTLLPAKIAKTSTICWMFIWMRSFSLVLTNWIFAKRGIGWSFQRAITLIVTLSIKAWFLMK
jgi:hypothetical protein